MKKIKVRAKDIIFLGIVVLIISLGSMYAYATYSKEAIYKDATEHLTGFAAENELEIEFPSFDEVEVVEIDEYNYKMIAKVLMNGADKQLEISVEDTPKRTNFEAQFSDLAE